jgi:uncharacterized protein YciI
MKIFFIVAANDFGSTKTNPSQSPKHKKKLRASGNSKNFWCGGKLLNRLSAVALHAIPQQAICAIVATCHKHATP